VLKTPGAAADEPVVDTRRERVTQREAAARRRDPVAVAALVAGLAALPLVRAGVVALLALGLGGAALWRSRARRSATGLATAGSILGGVSFTAFLLLALARTVSGEGTSVGDLAVGQCATGDVDRARVTVVACEEPHDAEVFALPAHPAAPGDPYPGLDALAAFAAEQCQPALEAYAGPAAVDALGVVSYRPTEAAWAAGERRVVCAVVRGDDGPLTGTVQGAFFVA
jgi:hypothetical protein